MVVKKRIVAVDEQNHTVLFAVNSTLDEFRFCNALNVELDISLQMQSPRNYEVNGVSVIHSFYSYFDDNKKNQFDCIANKTDKGNVVEFMETITYFLKVSNIYITSEIQDIQQKISQLESVIFIQKIDFTKLTQRQQKVLLHLFQ